MEKITEQMNIQMYNYGISEWREKYHILSSEERREVLKALVYGKPSLLLTIVKLPFPQFARMYFKRLYPVHPLAESFLYDPQFEYKLYFMTLSEMRFLAELLRNPEMPVSALLDKIGLSNHGINIKKIGDFFSTRLEDITKLTGGPNNTNKIAVCKYAYISQYIDLKEAKRMNLSIASQFELEGSDGYEFNKKLDSLNIAARTILEKYIGLYGESSKSLANISKELGISSTVVKRIIDILLPYMSKTLGDFRNKIGYDENRMQPNSVKEYLYGPYKACDIAAELDFIKHNVISDLEKQFLVQSDLKKTEINLYLARKYMFPSKEKTAINMNTTPQEVVDVFSTKTL